MPNREKCSICKTLNCLQCEHLTPVRDSLKIKHIKKQNPIITFNEKTIEIVPNEDDILEPIQIEKIPSVLSIKQETQPNTGMLVESNETSIESSIEQLQQPEQPQLEYTIHESNTNQQLKRDESNKSLQTIKIPKVEPTNAQSNKSRRCCVLQ